MPSAGTAAISASCHHADPSPEPRNLEPGNTPQATWPKLIMTGPGAGGPRAAWISGWWHRWRAVYAYVVVSCRERLRGEIGSFMKGMGVARAGVTGMTRMTGITVAGWKPRSSGCRRRSLTGFYAMT